MLVLFTYKVPDKVENKLRWYYSNNITKWAIMPATVIITAFN